MRGITLIILIFIVLSCDDKGTIESSMRVYPADGRSSGQIVLKKGLFSHDDHFKETGTGGDIFTVIRTKRSFFSDTIFFKSGLVPGEAVFVSEKGSMLKINFQPPQNDADSDGFPDSAELNDETDKNSFRMWFSRIAESQFIKRNNSWNSNERDCAGLVRYSYREALKKHDSAWIKRSGIVIDKNISDIVKFNFPEIPVLGDRLFKTRPGPADDVSSFGHFADASTLISLNMSRISRDLNDAEIGDVLFFLNESNLDYPYHSMVVTAKGSVGTMLVYHTGSGDVVKRVELGYLKKSKYFVPNPSNPYFLGVYRFKILE